MIVDKTIRIDNENWIEFGQSSWDITERSVRRRKNNAMGKFSPRGSSEIPLDGHVTIATVFIECLRNDEICDQQTLIDIIDEIRLTAGRQNIIIP